MVDDKYLEGDKVIVHSLGKSHPGEFKAVIRGIAVEQKGPARIYIIQLEKPLDSRYHYSCISMPAACIRRDGGV